MPAGLLMLSDGARRQIATLEREVVSEFTPRFAALSPEELHTLVELLAKLEDPR